ncbi:DUF6302 family protein [Nocardia sp. NPDC052278]|uniref:DUF6302 family protein n=1 Tax=unclassified Nocardia TaxID=2637762 RepID=UPI0036C97B71
MPSPQHAQLSSDQSDLVPSTGRTASQIGRELLYYLDRLAEPSLLAYSLATETGSVAVPVSKARRAGMVLVTGPADAEATMALLTEYDGFPDLRSDMNKHAVIWGAELPIVGCAPATS